MSSSLSETMKKRNQVSSTTSKKTLNHLLLLSASFLCFQLMWKFVASEEDYVSQLTILNEEYRQHLEIAAASQKPPLTLKQANNLFRNR